MAASDDGLCPIDITWMPAHTAEHDVGKVTKSSGEVLTAADRTANGKVDVSAKQAAQSNRTPKRVRDMIEQEAGEVSQMAVWLARVTHFANNFPFEGKFIRDSTADPAAKRARKGVKRKAAAASWSEPSVNSAVLSYGQVDRMLKVPRLAALRERILAKTG